MAVYQLDVNQLPAVHRDPISAAAVAPTQGFNNPIYWTYSCCRPPTAITRQQIVTRWLLYDYSEPIPHDGDETLVEKFRLINLAADWFWFRQTIWDRWSRWMGRVGLFLHIRAYTRIHRHTRIYTYIRIYAYIRTCIHFTPTRLL